VPVALDAALEELALLWEERLLGSQTIELSRTYRHGGPSMKDGEAAPPETLVFSQKSGVLHIEIRGQIFDYDGKILKLDKGNGAARVEVPAESAAVALVRAGIALRQLGPDLAARVVRDPKASLRGAMSKGSWRRMPDETLGGVQCWVLRREAGAANWPEETLWIRSDNGLVQRRVTRLSRPVTDGAPAVVFDEEWTLELPAAGK
jgi:hypothetical protein